MSINDPFTNLGKFTYLVKAKVTKLVFQEH